MILVDPDGQAPEGPIYGEYGKLIGYIVEAGQGPTQIAQDLNQNYRCELSCDAEFTQIVYDNSTQFQNVFDGKGNIEDKYNGNYKFGNIKAGDVLLITNGKTTEAEKITERIESKSKAVDSFLESKEKIYDEIKFQESIPKSGIYIDDPKEAKMAKSLLLTNTYAPMLGAYNQLIRENNDSIKILREQLKDLKE